MTQEINTPRGPNGWSEWKNHVLYQIEQNTSQHSEINGKLDKIQTALDQMQGASKIKLAMFSVGVPALVAIVGTAITLYLSK